MRVVINNIVRSDAETKVSFSTAFGKAEALWEGDEPQVGEEYYTEFDIDQILHWGVNISISSVETSSIAFDADTGLIIVGQLEYYDDDDGYGDVRMGDSVITFIADGEQGSKHIGHFIKISVASATLFEYKV